MISLKEITDISHYLRGKNIAVTNSFENDNRDLNNITEDMIIDHLRVISLFHENTLGYSNYLKGNIKNKTGITLEKYKLDLKQINKYLKQLNTKTDKNEFEEILLNDMPGYLNRGQRVIDTVYEQGYINLVWRSMKRKEICLGKPYFNNIREKDGIEVIDISDCSYNMIELDCIELLYKLNKKNLFLDIEKLDKKFCDFENLNNDSYNFILNMMSYPYSIIKFCKKYIKNNKFKDAKKYLDKFNKAKKIDNNSFT